MWWFNAERPEQAWMVAWLELLKALSMQEQPCMDALLDM